MLKDNSASAKELLKKLRRKAELCRYSHSELKEKYKLLRNLKEFIVIILSVSLSLLIGLYYREILKGEWTVLVVFILPSIIIMIQTLDTTLFHWTRKTSKHATAVQIWGNWIREADFIEKQICQCAVDVKNEKLKNIQDKYSDCMNNTLQIPNRKFLKYKKDFREYSLKSKNIDTMSLDDIEAEKKHAQK